MKVSRGIRKGRSGAILIAFAAAMLAVCISPALASATYIPPDPANLVNSTGRYWVNYTWQAGSGWHLIAGEAGGGFYGYNWTGSVWQSDSAIASGLPEEDNSTLTVFDMGNVTDSYNVSINGSWHNGTTNTSINKTVSPSGWVNITVWAWNASDTGTLSAVCISDNVQAPKDPNSTFGLVGSVPTGGRDGTYPPGWHETPAPAVTATKSPMPSTTSTATAAPPGERVTPRPMKAKPAAAKAATPAAEETATTTPKKDAPGFTAVFVIAGMLAVAYAMMRRRG